jgi:hypothetical protein
MSNLIILITQKPTVQWVLQDMSLYKQRSYQSRLSVKLMIYAVYNVPGAWRSGIQDMLSHSQ